ncbi:MAG TPA: MFS transporter, partial [Candidatus Thermoplasmatota archaeon]|nr:MFS transporter [Candidatus Thermoplasmatota archaeon]
MGGLGPPAVADESPLQSRTESLVLVEGVASRLMDALTGGVILAGLALLLGADNLTLALIAALPFFAQVAQLPAVALLLRVHDRRKVAVAATLAARLVLLVLAVLLALHRLALPALVAFTALLAALTVLSTAAWNAWMRDAMDPGRLGRFFAFRQQVATIVGGLGLLGAGWLLDSGLAARPHAGYALLFAAGGAAGLVSVWLLARTPQPAAVLPGQGERRSALHHMVQAMRRSGHGWMAASLSLASCSLAVALPFSSVYLLRGLGYSFLAVTGLALASQVAYVLGLRAWGRLSDGHGNRPVLQVASLLLAACLVGWSVTWPPG